MIILSFPVCKPIIFQSFLVFYFYVCINSLIRSCFIYLEVIFSICGYFSFPPVSGLVYHQFCCRPDLTFPPHHLLCYILKASLKDPFIILSQIKCCSKYSQGFLPPESNSQKLMVYNVLVF